MTAATKACAVAISVWLAACSTSPQAGPAPQRAAATECVVANERALSPQARQAATTLQRSVETGALFRASAGRTTVTSCSISVDSGVTSVEYRFRDGGWLRAKRDASIEYSDQEARFVTPPQGDPLAILRRAENDAFGSDGCGIDWKEMETQAPDDDRSAVERIYRGEACNCQARVRSNAAGQVVGLTMRSAC